METNAQYLNFIHWKKHICINEAVKKERKGKIDIKIYLYLQICGINMRTASQEMASQILKQVGNSLSLLVQHNPDGKCIN